MHLTSYGTVAPIQSSMVGPRTSGKASVKLHEDGAVSISLPTNTRYGTFGGVLIVT